MNTKLGQSYATPTKAFVMAYADEANITPLEAERTLTNVRQDKGWSWEEIFEKLQQEYPDLEEMLAFWEQVQNGVYRK